ncbi:lanosterol synthase [Rhizopus microsporus ATCC 52813]|uniref:Terpene cyclase/mutase family member n=1 Tax=Rhizopus microsporus ATCC 52813 TaxID=1340429 RepID=A0A2G4SWW2_RHIZD|nr:lanosterol synthase [Rhizopus microsporus ATCC 52813]PHZ13235.1 lanosterol synthase [Rhizopus microsporus ATCC 52813]
MGILPEDFPSAKLNLTANPQFTDLTHWRLNVDEGSQIWQYLETEQERQARPQSICEKYHLGLPIDVPELEKAKTPLEAARNGFEFYRRLQTEDGHWAGEYGGPMFLLPGLIIAHYVTRTPVHEPTRLEMIRYLLNKANKEDGGWGIHIEGVSTVFGTALNYVTLRILGLGPDHPAMVKARNTLHRHGGAAAIPAWGKFWLAVLGVYDWNGVNPIPPELWALPKFVPLYPGNWWVHCRNVYLSMGYIYGHRVTAPLTTFTQSLREELYVQPYDTINWDKQRNNVAEVDLYMPHTKIMDVVNYALTYYESFAKKFTALRDYGLKEAVEQIRMEDENTYYMGIGPVNKAMNWLVWYHHSGKDSLEFKLHVERNAHFLWLGAEGMMMNGTDGTQLWDTAFIAQACAEAGLAKNAIYRENMVKVLEFLDMTQIRENPKDMERCNRQATKGAWPFSTKRQGYTVSDCTAEGLKSSIILQTIPEMPTIINPERFLDSVDILLSMQNRSGGYGSYEKNRATPLLEAFNPAEVFGNIMVEYEYPECTTAVLHALRTFIKLNPDYRRDEIEAACQGCVKYIKSVQGQDGSWYGAWGICYTYAAMFALSSLSSVGEYYENSDSSRRGCDFLIQHQKEDGGWGESYKSCEVHQYCQHEQSQVVNTAWAVMALLDAKYPHKEPIRRGIELIMKRQQPNGEWLQEAIEGVFNKNCAISYPNYKFSFSIWALGKYTKVYGDNIDP